MQYTEVQQACYSGDFVCYDALNSNIDVAEVSNNIKAMRHEEGQPVRGCDMFTNILKINTDLPRL